MRGSPKSSSQTHLRTGIIPAHAGLTIMCILIPIQLRDHPRACGAHDQFTIKLISAMGSSPRMRGSRLARRQSSAAQGIIPAHAGLTLDTPDRFYRARDHPRACGAHSISSDTRSPPAGSSPRMRGSLAAASTNANTNGIIPAHAGLTFYGLSSRFSCRDHPRACGAHRLLHTPHPLHEGSSPRMRGSRKIRQPNKRCNGIIPAHAGLTAVSPSMRSARWDHPRACGAHVRRRSGAFESMGSSPRMRGSRRAARDNLEAIGIIPAHAGLTSRSSRRSAAGWDHPRACGAH